MNVCGSCGRDFSSIRAFDSHRVGRHAYLFESDESSSSRHDGRRCLNQSELHAAGFVQNSRGRWALAIELARVSQRFSGEPRSEREPTEST
jgi:hypothetical protein